MFVNKLIYLIQIASHPEVIFKIYYKYVRNYQFCNWTFTVWCVVCGLWRVIVSGFVYRLVGVNGDCVPPTSSTHKL
jgi:hypothetical protein